MKNKKEWTPKNKWYIDSNGKRRRIGAWSRITNPHVSAWVRNKEQDILAGVEKKIGNAGHVYIFSLGRDNLYKIGCTTQILRRFKSLKASNPYMKLVWSAWVKDMKAVEKQIHEIYKNYRLDREIFTLSLEQIVNINDFVNELKENYPQ